MTENEETGLQKAENNQLQQAIGDYLEPSAVLKQIQLVQQVMHEAMKEGEHYGSIPGTSSDKKVLLKSGAEKLGFMFRMIPKYDVACSQLMNGHREYQVTCTLESSRGQVIGQGVGLCSSMESKYRWRKAQLACPVCGKSGTVIKGKAEYGGGWLCWQKKDGCGAKFEDGDQRIENQPRGRVANTDLADTFNTVLKMAKKRAHVDAILTATAASDIFTQDLDDSVRADVVDVQAVEEPPHAGPPKPSKKRQAWEVSLLHARETMKWADDEKIQESAAAAVTDLLPQFDVDSVDELPDEKFDDFLVLLEASFYPGEAKEMSP